MNICRYKKLWFIDILSKNCNMMPTLPVPGNFGHTGALNRVNLVVHVPVLCYWGVLQVHLPESTFK